MSAAELLALLAFCHRDELLAGAQHHAVHRAGGQPRPAARAALLPGRAHRLDAADGWPAGSAWARWSPGVPALSWAIKLAGVAYMLWLAFKLAGSGPAGAGRRGAGSTSHSSQGVGLQFLNIKAWMLALTLTAGWVVNAGRPARRQPGRAAGDHLRHHGGVRLHQQFRLCAGGLAAARSGSRKARRLLWFNRVLALVLAATAAWMLTV